MASNTGIADVTRGGVTVTDSKSSLATDPLRNYKFHVIINHGDISGRIGFMSVSGLSVNTEVITYRQGGHNTTTQKMPGQSDFGPITLSRGLAVGDTDFLDWMQTIFVVTQGGQDGTAGSDFRADSLDILVLAHPWTKNPIPVHAAFRVYNAWPSALAFSDFDAGASALVVQQMTLAHEGWEAKIAAKRDTGVYF